jgi:hypothetical protein
VSVDYSPPDPLNPDQDQPRDPEDTEVYPPEVPEDVTATPDPEQPE